MANEIVSAWAKFFDDNDLQWLVKLDPEKQALIKKAFFAGAEAAQHSVHPTVLESPQKSITCQPYGCVDYDGTPASLSG